MHLLNDLLDCLETITLVCIKLFHVFRIEVLTESWATVVESGKIIDFNFYAINQNNYFSEPSEADAYANDKLLDFRTH